LLWLAAGAAHAQTAGASNYNARPLSLPPPPTFRLATSAPAAPAAGAVAPVAFQRPAAVPLADEPRVEYQIQLEPPGLERISRLDSDKKLQDRIAQETKEREFNEQSQFPDEPILSRDVYYGRAGIWPRRTMVVEPSYVCFDRLYFQDINAERYGWDLGPIHPVVSTAKFFYDFVLLPVHIVNDPFGHDCSAGYCLPGDPAPFLLYPPEITLKGVIAEVGVILALVAIFP
jgi:hypothetical protein